MSGFGAQLERTGLGPHAWLQKRSSLQGVCAVKKKTGQVLVRTSGCENASDLNDELSAMSGGLKFVVTLGSYGNVHTGTARGWSEQKYLKLVSELP